MSDITDDIEIEDGNELIEIEDAHPVRDEGTIIIFEGVAFFEDEEPEVVWFGVDHRMAPQVMEAVEEGCAVGVEAWQIMGRTEVVK